VISNFDEIKRQLKELSEVINSFKSEAVQLRLVDLVFQAATGRAEPESAKDSHRPPGRKKHGSRKPSAEPSPREPGARRAARAGGRPGSVATLGTLFSGGFFKTPRTLKSLVEHCEANLALKYKQSDFSGALARYVRDQKLKRVKDSDGQYEYSTK
jgi:hypothetical protein